MAELGIVETHCENLQLDKPFELEHGGSLSEITVAYEAYGTLNDEGTNAILICPTLTSDAHAAGYHSDDPKTEGWWDSLIGPGKAVDTNTYYVVCSNILGGCKGTTGPSSISPETGKPYGIAFPKVTVKDVVNVQKALIDQLGIKRLAAIIGGSLGGMQTLEWAIQYPDFVDKCVCIAAGVNISPQALAFDIIARQEIEHDPNWNDGDYYERETPENGLSRARQIGHVTYLSSASMQNKFGREEREGYSDLSEIHFSTNFQVESYLNYQGKKFVDRFDANSYLYITRMMDLFDLEKEHGSIREALRKIKCRFLVVGITSDWLFPLQQQLDIANALIAEKKDVSFFRIDSPYGHDAFLIEYDILNRGVEAFLNGKRPGAQFDINAAGLKELDGMIEESHASRILDLGSGDGSLILALTQSREISTICLDCSFDMVVECMKKGLNAVHFDADKALPGIVEDSFDLILLNQTLQQFHSALQTLKHVLRIAPKGVVSFPNFAYYKCRLSVGFSGRLPVSDALPYEWYNSPNIHLITLKDFRSLCDKNAIRISKTVYLTRSIFGAFLTKLGFQNAGAEKILVSLER